MSTKTRIECITTMYICTNIYWFRTYILMDKPQFKEAKARVKRAKRAPKFFFTDFRGYTYVHTYASIYSHIFLNYYYLFFKFV